ncbi:phage baseplate assembly protein V [Cronobacter turicensis]|nr:phage baseplate assembly protein V [Cronobacter turicensis]
MNEQIAEIQRLLRNLIRIGTVSTVNLDDGLCRIDTGNNTTGWLHWLSARAGKTRSWNAPSVGEQVLVLCIGGELDTGFVLPGIFSDANPAPSASSDALHWSFPDGAVIEYEPASGALQVAGIQTASISAAKSATVTVPVVTVTASTRVTFDTPEVVCTNKLITGTFEVQKGGTMKGNIQHSGGALTSNGVRVDEHGHGGVQRGGSWTEGTK